MAPYRGPSERAQVAVTPAAASAAISARMVSWLGPGSSGAITSATPIACGSWVPSARVSSTRAVEPTPNQSCAGLSSVHQCSAVSTSGWPNGRPMTAVAVWYTGRPPGTSAGKRIRSRWSCPAQPSTWVRNSTRCAPSQSSVSWMTVSPSRSNSASSRDPAGQRCALTRAGTPAEPWPGPFGLRCQGPSFQRG